MTLNDLIASVRDLTLSGSGEVEVRGLAYDSRRVGPGFVYCALKGGRADGADFIDQAIAAGAVAVVSERAPDRTGVSWLRTTDARRAMAAMAAAWQGWPSRGLRVAGVTGTNGKTTIAFLLHHLMVASRGRAGLIGTVLYDDGVSQRPASHTTPESVDLQEWLSRMAANGCGGVAMEVSSHALVQHRTDGIAFDAAIFTNLTQDHLDFHGTMEAYFEAKAMLFDRLAVMFIFLLPERGPWRGADSNRRHHDFQSCALPTELPRPELSCLPVPARLATAAPFARADASASRSGSLPACLAAAGEHSTHQLQSTRFEQMIVQVPALG